MRDLYDAPELHRVFAQGCLDKFGYLAGYGFELTSIEEDEYGVEVTYKNQTTGIKISFEIRENQIFVYLIRLIHAEIPPYLSAPSHWFYLDNVVKLRSPIESGLSPDSISTTLSRKGFGDWLTPDDIDRILTVHASALKEYGEDVLRGDFSVFVELARQIERPEPSSGDEESPAERLRAQQARLPAQITEYYDTYFSELRRQLQRPDLFLEAVPEWLKGYKRVISIGGRDGVVVAHFPVELEITMSETDGGRVLIQFPGMPDATQDSYEFIQFPGSPVGGLVEFISGEEDVGAIISPEASWGTGVAGVFNEPQRKLDPATGQLVWQAPWTRLAFADFNHLYFWEDTERARREAKEDIELYVRDSEHTRSDEVRAPEAIEEAGDREVAAGVSGSSGPELLGEFGHTLDNVVEHMRLSVG